jgi:copper chaperone
MAQAILTVPDISCEHCEKTITETLLPQAGVQSVRVDIPAKQVHLDFDPNVLPLSRVEELLAEEEYPVSDSRTES